MANCVKCKEMECHFVKPKNVEHDCKWFNPITNADYIRDMTDEELAEWLSKNDPECDPKEWWLGWLKQECNMY